MDQLCERRVCWLDGIASASGQRSHSYIHCATKNRTPATFSNNFNNPPTLLMIYLVLLYILYFFHLYFLSTSHGE